MYTAQSIVRHLWEKGMSDKSIGIAIGRSRSAITAIRYGQRDGSKCQEALNLLLQLSKKQLHQSK